jgi:hypothetical protein
MKLTGACIDVFTVYSLIHLDDLTDTPNAISFVTNYLGTFSTKLLSFIALSVTINNCFANIIHI